MLRLLYIDVVTMFLACCKCSPSRCNRFSFMLQIVVQCCIHVLHMLQMSHANVSKLGLNFSMLQSLIFDVANAESRCCRHVLLGVANVIFSMLQMLRFDVTDMWCWVLC
jgi:hypothetical protein